VKPEADPSSAGTFAVDSSSAVTLRAVKLVGGGVALSHADGITWMVRGALPGELVRARPDRFRARVVEATTLELVADPHPARLADGCPHAPACGGCDWPHVDNDGGARLKAEVAAEASGPVSILAERLRAAPVTASPGAYRLRCRLHWDPAVGRLGFFGSRSREVIAIPDCRIITRTLSARLADVTAALASRCPAPVDLEWLEGDDGVVAALRPAPGNGSLPEAGWMLPRNAIPDLAGCHRLTARGRLLDGWGLDRVHMALPISLEVPIGSFFQGNRHLIHWLFLRLAELIGQGDEPVFDLHGGVGFIAAAARHGGRIGLTVVEPHPPAAAAARRNLSHARIVTATAERFVGGATELPPRSLVVTDPPRTGMTTNLRNALVRWRPKRLIMLGCDPATWSRDAGSLIERGYHLTHLELVDLFPFTHHVEVLAVLEDR
jgi:23S rRNA (uracil1939-C5)-methyltransferase